MDNFYGSGAPIFRVVAKSKLAKLAITGASSQGRELRLTMILTRTPHASRTLETYVKLALLACSHEHSVAVYLVGDGVYCARKGQNLANYLARLCKSGGELFVRMEDVEARGLDVEKLIENVEVPVDFYGKLVDDIMEKSDRVISL